MENLIKKLTERQFRYISGALSFLGDVVLVVYIYLQFSDFNRFIKLFQIALSSQGQSINKVPKEFIQEQYLNAMNSVKFMLGALLFIHFIVYTMHALKKVAASKYLKFSLIITIATSALFIYEAWSVNKTFSIIFILLVPTYLFCYQGIKIFNLDQRPQKNKGPKKSPDLPPPKTGGV
jgi:hypothetical protein